MKVEMAVELDPPRLSLRRQRRRRPRRGCINDAPRRLRLSNCLSFGLSVGRSGRVGCFAKLTERPTERRTDGRSLAETNGAPCSLTSLAVDGEFNYPESIHPSIYPSLQLVRSPLAPWPAGRLAEDRKRPSFAARFLLRTFPLAEKMLPREVSLQMDSAVGAGE